MDSLPINITDLVILLVLVLSGLLAFLRGETGLDAAIARGLSRVEAGAQGGHKLAPGYGPVETWSAHWIVDPGFRDAVADFLTRERQGVATDKMYLGRRTPFRKAD